MDAQWIPITKLKPGERAVIRSFSENNSDGDYLMELGLMIGTTVTM
ncbi:MAG: ferrous iron transport protein A, partial [Aliifodinibius sp.]|nr:ferrous iron transport protein A [Fodinibius sp.]